MDELFLTGPSMSTILLSWGKEWQKTAVKTPSFDAYKTIKDEISELRFENLLTKKPDLFRREFKK